MATQQKTVTLQSDTSTVKSTTTLTDKIPGYECNTAAGITYTGARYVPLFAEPSQWSNENTYEPLTIVLNEGNSYTSKQFVPAGVDINNTNFWAETGNYNAQIEAYREEVRKFDERITNNTNAITNQASQRYNALSSTAESEYEIEYNNANKIVANPNYAVNYNVGTYNPLAILNVINGYYRAPRTDLVYGNDFTATNLNDTYTDWYDFSKLSKPYNIDCTTFVILVSMGIYYSNSLYSNHINLANNEWLNMFSNAMKEYIGYEYAQIGDTEVPDNHRRLLASEFAKLLYDSGHLVSLKGDTASRRLATLKIGDIIFLKNADENIHWEGIGHCGIVASKIGTNVIVAEATNNQTGLYNDCIVYTNYSTSTLWNQVVYKCTPPALTPPEAIVYSNIQRHIENPQNEITQSFISPGNVFIANYNDATQTISVSLSVNNNQLAATSYTLAQNQAVNIICPAGSVFSSTGNNTLNYTISINQSGLDTSTQGIPA